MKILNNSSFQLLERSLDAATLRQRVIANNVANVDTPLFKRSSVQFEEILESAMNSTDFVGYRTDSRHFQIGKSSNMPLPRVAQDHSTIINNNLNNVDIDYEMTLMAKNQLRYNAMIDQVNGSISKLRTAIGRA